MILPRVAGEGEVDCAMMRKNMALHRYMADWPPGSSEEKEFVESESD